MTFLVVRPNFISNWLRAVTTFRYILIMPVPVAARPKALVCGRSLIENAGSNTAGSMDVCPLGVLCIVR